MKTLEVEGKMSWHNRERGLGRFVPTRRDAGPCMLFIAEMRDSRSIRPGGTVTVRFEWMPEVDVLMPWQAREMVVEDGSGFSVMRSGCL